MKTIITIALILISSLSYVSWDRYNATSFDVFCNHDGFQYLIEERRGKQIAIARLYDMRDFKHMAKHMKCKG